MSFLNIRKSPASANISPLFNEVTLEMLSRLDWMTMKPQTILDMNQGVMIELLQKRYPHATMMTSDASHIPDASVDMVIAHFILPWASDFKSLLQAWRRILRKEGLLMLTALGPDTFKEWQKKENIIPALIDMHDLGDLLMQQGFTDPVLDVNQYTMVYRDPNKLITELDTDGMITLDESYLPKAKDGTWEMTYEVIHAHAFAAQSSILSDGVVKVPLSQLKR